MQESPGHLLLLGKPQESLHLLSDPLLGKHCSVVRAPGEAAIDTMAAVLRPKAILLEASELYLGGRAVQLRLKERSGDSRVLFLDVEGPWALLMEFESEDTNDLLIQPCALDGLGEALREALDHHQPGSESGADSDQARSLTGYEDDEGIPSTSSPSELHSTARTP